jgi:hypothetical protein
MYSYVEQQLTYSTPEQQQLLIYQKQQEIIQAASSLSPENQAIYAQMLNESMSPQLAQIILVPIITQYQQQHQQPSQQSEIPPNENNNIPPSQTIEDCVAFGNSRAACEAIEKPDFGICSGLAMAKVPCPVPR